MPQDPQDHGAHEQQGANASNALNGADEAALIQEAQRDLAAFGPLYLRYVDRIYTYLCSRTGSARADEAADLTQQVFVRALDALPRYQPHAGISVAAWLFRIARNAATDWHRRQGRTVPWEVVPEELRPRVPDTAEGALLRRDDIAEARRLLGTLDAESREALLLRFTGQLTLAEIGVVLGASEEAVRKRIARALQRLRARAREQDQEQDQDEEGSHDGRA